MGQQYPYSTRWENTIVPNIHLLEIEPVSYYYVFIKTLNLSNMKYILGYLNQYSPKKYIKGSMGQQYILYKMGGGNAVVLYIYGSRAVPLLFWDHQDTESE